MHSIFCYCSVSMRFLRGYSSDHRAETMTRQTRLKVMILGKIIHTHTQIFHYCSVQFVWNCDSGSCYWYYICLAAPSKTWTANMSWLPAFEVSGKFVQIQGQMSNIIEFHLYAGKVQDSCKLKNNVSHKLQSSAYESWHGNVKGIIQHVFNLISINHVCNVICDYHRQ